MLLFIVAVLIVLHVYRALEYQNKIQESNLLSKSKKQLNIVMVWLIPFIWYWFIKGFIKPSGVMTKSKRRVNKSNFYESGIGFEGGDSGHYGSDSSFD